MYIIKPQTCILIIKYIKISKIKNISNFEEIYKSINHLHNLLSSKNNLKLANNKSEDLFIKKLTVNAPLIAEKFEEIEVEMKNKKRKKMMYIK